jgi:hypothetical protein
MVDIKRHRFTSLERTMPITAYLDGQAFAPEVREAMSEAFREACDMLSLTSPTHPLRERVARYIIELSKRGIRSKAALYFMTVDEFMSRQR